MHIQPAGSGAPALKYLGAYVARTAINDSRLLAIHEESLTFRWKDRSDHNQWKIKTLSGVEFVQRYLRHALPIGLRSIRYYGFCHPAAKAKRLRVQLHSGRSVHFGPTEAGPSPATLCSAPLCPKCGQAMRLISSFSPWHKTRGPPTPPTMTPLISTAA